MVLMTTRRSVHKCEVATEMTLSIKTEGEIFHVSGNSITWQSFVRFCLFTCLHRVQVHRDRDFFCLLVCVPISSAVHSFRNFLHGMRVAYHARGHYLFVFALAALQSSLQSKQLRFFSFLLGRQTKKNLKWKEMNARRRCIAPHHAFRLGDNERSEQQIRRYGVTLDFHSIIRGSAFIICPCMKENNGEDNQIFRPRELIKCARFIVLDGLTIRSLCRSFSHFSESNSNLATSVRRWAADFRATGLLRVQPIGLEDFYHGRNLSQSAQIEMNATQSK